MKRFHPPLGRFDGIIGGPPCQFASRFRFLNPAAGRHGNLIPEFERIVWEGQPGWFVMENVPDAPRPQVGGYSVRDSLVNNRWLGEEQERLRRFSFGSSYPVHACRVVSAFSVEQSALESPLYARAVTSDARTVPVKMVRDGKGGHKPKRTSLKPPTVTGGHGAPFDRETMSIARMAELQGLPPDFLSEAPFTAHGKRKAIGNGVPLPMGRAVARAVKRALGIEAVA